MMMQGSPTLVPTDDPPNVSPARAVWLAKVSADRRIRPLALRLAVLLAAENAKPPLEVDLVAMAAKLKATALAVSHGLHQLAAYGFVEIENVRRSRAFIRLSRPR